MFSRTQRALVRVTLVWVGAASVAAAQSGGGASPAAPPDSTPALRLLVRDAVARNLTLETARFAPEIAAADIQAARGAFDAQIRLQPALGRTRETVITPDGKLSGSYTTTTVSGGAGGLLPYGAVGVAGNLATGMQYGLSVESARQAQDPLSLVSQTHPVQFNTNVTVSIAQPLMRGAGPSIARAGIRSAALGADASRAGFARVIDTTAAHVESAYWTAVYSRAVERVVNESLQRARTLLERNEQLVQLQLAADIDVLTARQGVAAREAALTQARQERAEATDAVVFLVYGRDAAVHLQDVLDLDTATLPERVAAVPDDADAQTRALEARQDLREAELFVVRAEVGVDVARNSLRPILNLSGSYTALTNSVSNVRPFGADRVGDVARVGWEGGLFLTVPVGNNRAKAAFAQATLVQRQQEAVVETVKNDVRQDVRLAVRAIRMNGERVRQTTQALQFARQGYDSENQRLQLGLSDSFRVLQFEDQISQAQKVDLQARFQLIQAAIAFDLARGSSATKYGVALPHTALK